MRQLAVAGIRAADAGDLLLAALSADSLLDRGAAGRTFVIAVGKASVPMYRAFLHWATRPPHAAIVAAPDATEGLGDGALHGFIMA